MGKNTRRGPGPTYVLAVMTFFLVVSQAFIWRIFAVSSGSMENTLLVGDRVLTLRFPKPELQRFDLLVYRLPLDGEQVTVKRIVGMPGDHLRMTSGVLAVNGIEVKEPYVVHNALFGSDNYRDNIPPRMPYKFRGLLQFRGLAEEMLAKCVMGGELVVPTGKYFVLGDNRENSLDSRFTGLVSDEDVVGKAMYIYFSLDVQTNDRGEPKSSSVRWDRLFKRLR